MIVVDTNIIAYLYLLGENTTFSERTLKIDSDWVAPRLWRSEFRSVLTKYVSNKFFSLEDALKIAAEAECHMAEREYEVPSAHVLPLTQSSGCSSYDCEFVALAQNLNVPLITSDKKILRAFPKIAISLKTFAS